MDSDYILQELKPIDFKKERGFLTLIFPGGVVIFLREAEEGELMWNLFDNKESVDAGADEEKHTVKLLRGYLKTRFAAKKT